MKMLVSMFALAVLITQAVGADLQELKAAAYDAIQEIERQQDRLREITHQIAKLEADQQVIVEAAGADLETGAKDAAYVAISAALAKRPEWEPEFKMAFEQIKAIEKFERQGLEDMLAVVRRLPVKELKSDSASISITDDLVIFKEMNGMEGVIEEPEQLRAILRGLGNGMRRARPEWGKPKPPPSPVPLLLPAPAPAPLPLYDERDRKARPTEVR